jgi:ribosome recycling factor
MPANKIVSEHDAKMNKTVEYLHDEFKTLRTGRASAALVENIKVDYYGTPTLLKQLAALATPQADLIVIKPFDPACIKEIEKAIKSSDLSIAPMVDGKVIRLSIPPLSEERRKQIVGQAKQMAEQTKINVRNLRRDAIKHLETEEKSKIITEDDLENGKKHLDEMTKKYVDKVDSILKAKSDEIMLH